MVRKVLFLMSETGGGHRSAAQALAAAIKNLAGERYQTDYRLEMVDALAAGRFPVSLAPDLYALSTRYFPPLWGWSFHWTNGRLRTRLMSAMFDVFVGKRLESTLREKEPQVIVSVHPLLNHVTCKALQRLGWHTPFLVVGTELVTIHRAWVCPEVDCHIVPTEEARQAAIEYGMPLDKIKLIGPPVHPRFLEEMGSKEQVRQGLNLAPELPTLLLVSGGEGTGQVYDFALAISGLGLGLQLMVVTGRNKKLKARLDEVRFDVPAQIYGFVDNMPTLMRAADLIISRAGSITISEALVCGLPIILSDALPGQEEGNIDYIVSHKAGALTRTPDELINVLRRLLEEGKGEELQHMAHNAGRLINPRAVYEIARLIMAACP